MEVNPIQVQVRLLDFATERGLFVESYNWRNEQPTWFRQCLDVWKESLEEFLGNAPNELHYGVWHEDQFVAVIRLVQEKPGSLNIHLSVKKGIDWQVLLIAGTALRETLKDHWSGCLYGYLPVINKGISKLYECLGFSDSGIRVFKGVIHGRLIEWKHYVLFI